MTEYDYSPEAWNQFIEKQEKIARWTINTGRYAPADPFVPSTPAVRAAKALQREESTRRGSLDYRDRDRREQRPKHHGRSRSQSHSYQAPLTSAQPPVIPPMPSYVHPQARRSNTTQNVQMPLHLPQPRRANTQSYPYYPQQHVVTVPHGTALMIPPNGRPQLIHSPPISPPLSPQHAYPQYPMYYPQPQPFPPQQNNKSSSNGWLSKLKLGSIFSSSSSARSPSPSPREMKRSKSSKPDGKEKRKSRKRERRYSY